MSESGAQTSVISADTLDALAVLRKLRERGIALWVEDGKLRYRSPKAALQEQDVLNLRRLRDEIVSLVGGDVQEEVPFQNRDPGVRDVPLSPLQRLIWTDVARAGSWSRSHAFATRIRGVLHIESLAKALRQIVTRYPILRSTYSMSEGEPGYGPPFSGEQFDIVHCDDSEDVEASVDEFLDTRVDGTGPFFASRLFVLGARDHILAVSVDELVTDCRSDELLRRGIWADYPRIGQVGAVDVWQGEPKYADYALWLCDLFPSWQVRHGQYWRQRYSTANRGTGSHAPSWRNPAAKWTREEFGLDSSATVQLEVLARKADVYPAVAMLAAFVVAVFNSRRCSDVTVVVIDSGRHVPELRNIVGPLVNHLYLRMELRPELTFANLMKNVAAELRAAQQHRDFNWLPGLVTYVRADAYFNWITELEHPQTDVPSDLVLDLQPFGVRRLGRPSAGLGMVLHRGSRIEGEVICDAAVPGADVARQLSIGVRRALQGLQAPDKRVFQLLEG